MLLRSALLASILGLCVSGRSPEQVPKTISGIQPGNALIQLPTPTVVPFNASGMYDMGQKVGWTVTLPAGQTTTEKYSYTLKANNSEVIQSGDVDLSSGKATIETVLHDPAMLYMELTVPGQRRPLPFGAAVSPRKLKPVVGRPKDFDAFWKTKIKALEAVPENPVLTPEDSGKPGVDYWTIRMDLTDGSHVYGQLAEPSTPGKHPGIVIVQWASPPYALQKPWVTGLASQGWLALNIEPHDVLPTAPFSYYQGLPAELKNYASIGQQDRDKNYFLDMYLRDYRAVDYITQRPDWDGKTLVVNGGSMGGQQGLAVAGLHPKITHVIVEEPAGCDLNAALHGRQEGYPFYPTNDPKAMETARYFDCVNFAPHIKATALVAMGFVDTVCPPTGVWTAFNQIRGPKEAAPMFDAPHNNTATQAEQMPYYTRYGAWLAALAKGEKVEVREP